MGCKGESIQKDGGTGSGAVAEDAAEDANRSEHREEAFGLGYGVDIVGQGPEDDGEQHELLFGHQVEQGVSEPVWGRDLPSRPKRE